jgi:hypothetical protein
MYILYLFTCILFLFHTAVFPRYPLKHSVCLFPNLIHTRNVYFFFFSKISQVETYSSNKITRNLSKHIREFTNGSLSKGKRSAPSGGTKRVTFIQYICISKHTSRRLMCVNIITKSHIKHS